MKESEEDIDFQKMQSLFEEGGRWASLSITIQEIAEDNKALIKDVSRYDPRKTIPLLSGLLTIPEYQSNCIRLEVLVVLAVIYCNGQKKPDVRDVARWFQKIGASKCTLGEDPAEDVFVSLVQDRDGDYRLLEGIWEATGFYTQIISDVVSTMPDNSGFGLIKRSVRSMLVISDILCGQSKLVRYQLGSDERHTRLSVKKLPSKNKLASRVNIPFDLLDQYGICLEDIKPFLYHPSMKKQLLSHNMGNSCLDKHPLTILSKSHLTVLLPTAISVAIRQFVVDVILDNGLTDFFDNALAKKYSQLLYKTPLMGGPMRAPVAWKKNGMVCNASFGFEVDQGFFIFCHLFLPSVELHGESGLKEVITDDGSFTKELQKSIDSSVGKFSKEEGFKEGLVVLIGCGWGKGYVTGDIEFNYPCWSFEHISSADLVRLSWIVDMSPGYFWRIKDGLEAIERHGVTILNVNGILNLIGWVRENDGHFIPHAQLPEGEISPERPLSIQIPTNLLRNVRADADKGYDRHSIQDNMSVWHSVQYAFPEPLFSSHSSKKTYASMTDIGRGILTSVYEGKFNLWISIIAENISEKDVEYRLWEMASEWLHRIGKEFDKYEIDFNSGRAFKVYAEFQDNNPSHEPVKKPEEAFLLSLCQVIESEDINARRAVFKKGFLDGFGIAENIAERLFVLNVVRAFLSIAKEENIDAKASELLQKIVENKEARSYHFFHAQHFIDYMRDALPKNLVAIDAIDDGIARLGLGWRVLKGQPYDNNGNKVVGRKECNKFLSSVVDILVSEISKMLNKFNRRSALVKFVANYEKSSAEEDHWRRTSAAVLGLHGNNEETMNSYVKQTSKFAGAGISSRILIEMGLCMCPLDEGEELSDIELSKLIARASLMVKYGGLSDAILFNALTPELHVSPLGDILFKDDFGDTVVNPMLSRASTEKFVSSAPHQAKNYENPDIIVSTREKFGDEFWNLWIEEMGFSIDNARSIIGVLDDYGIDKRKVIFELKKSEFLKLICCDGVSIDVAERFLDQLTLFTRKKWDKVPSGFALEDIYPWKFGRRLSFVARPILAIDESDDPILMIAPGALRNGFTYLVGGAFKGRFRQTFFKTNKMKNDWWVKANEGHSFNHKAAIKLKEAGWSVKENIGLPELFNEKLDKDYGDIDILAWNAVIKKVLVIECKDLSFARNYSEIAALLSTFQGNVDETGKGDKLRVHLDRVSLIKQKLEKVERFTGISGVEIESCLVFSGIVPMQYAKIGLLNGSVVGSVDEVIKKYKKR